MNKTRKTGGLVRQINVNSVLKNGSNSECSLDTLEITSESSPNLAEIEDFEFEGDGSADIRNLVKRNASKYLNNWLVLKLIDTKSELEKKYWDSYHCSQNIRVEGAIAKSSFCKNRWCMICNRIRTAELIYKYMPTVSTWKDKQFITLTIKNPTGEDLHNSLEDMRKAFVKIKDKLRKQGIKLVGIRKLEITYNRHANTYHPHYHIITKSNFSNQIISGWLSEFPTARREAQDSRTADENSCFELFKYFTKITSNSSKDDFITATALDTIFRNIQGKRTFQSFGFVPHKEIDPRLREESEEISEAILFNWKKDLHTWINLETGESLTGWQPPKHLKEKVKKIKL